MKKIALILCFVFLSTTFALAQEKVGTVDMALIMTQYKKSKDVHTWAKNQDMGIQNFIKEASLKIQNAPYDEKSKMQEEYNKELAQKIQTLRKNKAQKISVVSKEIEKAVKQVADEGKYVLIVPKTAVLYGSYDVTPQVMKKLNSK